MKFEIIPLTLVDFRGDSFFLADEGDSSALKESIREIGLINPPVLRKKGGKYQIICGRKRLKACREIGLDEVTAKTYQLEEISQADCLKLISTRTKKGWEKQKERRCC